jgi:transcriptional regulator with XRE-family HTH domain
MRNARLEAAMAKNGVSPQGLAEAVGKTRNAVDKWLNGTVPRMETQVEIADELGTSHLSLWPRDEVGVAAAREEIVRAWARRSDCPPDYWWNLIVGTKHHVDILGYAVLFLTENHLDLTSTLSELMKNGGSVRIVIADPNGQAALDRDTEEGLDGLLLARIRSSIKYLRPVVDAGASLHFQNAPMYSSVFRFDDDMLMTPHLFGIPGKMAPLFHFRRIGTGGIFDQYATHFEGLLNSAVPQSDDQAPKKIDAVTFADADENRTRNEEES